MCRQSSVLTNLLKDLRVNLPHPFMVLTIEKLLAEEFVPTQTCTAASSSFLGNDVLIIIDINESIHRQEKFCLCGLTFYPEKQPCVLSDQALKHPTILSLKRKIYARFR